MFTPIFDRIPTIVSCTIAALICLTIGRNVRKSGLEHYSSRILLLSAIINTAVCNTILLLMGICGLWAIRGANQLDLLHFVMIAPLFVLPVRSIWNFFTTAKRLQKQLGLQPIETDQLQKVTHSFSTMMEITCPVILSSPQVTTPLVFGRNCRKAFLAVPTNWPTIIGYRQRVLLCHELAHIRNKDVGFFTWSFAFLADLRWLLILVPIITIISFFIRIELLLEVNTLYLVCLIILWLLTRSVLRKRELLADQTVAMLIESGKISDAMNEQQSSLSSGLHVNLRTSKSSRIINRIRNWFADKALFAERRSFWKLTSKLFDTFYSNHPPFTERLKNIKERDRIGNLFSVRFTESFWAGLSVGLLGVLIALGGLWFGRFFLKLQDYEKIVKIPYDLYGVVGPLAIGVVALLFVLPGWSSIKAVIPTGRRLISLLGRYLTGLFGAATVSLLILIGGWSHIEVKVLFVLNIIWAFFILFFGLGVNIVMLVLWLQHRYFFSHFLIDLLWAMYSVGLGICAVVAGFVIALVFFLHGAIILGSSIFLGMLAGTVILTLLAGRSSISGTDQYAAFIISSGVYRFEGRIFKLWAPMIGSIGFAFLCYIPAAVIFVIIYTVTRLYVESLDNFVALVLLGIIGCSVLVILSQRWSKCINEVRRHKICSLCESLALLERNIYADSRKVIDRLLDVYTVADKTHQSEEARIPKTQKIFELARLVTEEDRDDSNFLKQAENWARGCETQAGFGLWPGSSARLSSTYHSLCILQKSGVIRDIQADKHILWIKSLQQPDGYFKCPWSKRHLWEDTFFAAAGLKILGADWNIDKKEFCRSWAQKKFVYEGIEKGRLATVYYCLASIDTLDMLDIEVVERTYNWLSTQIEQLLLTNISHNSENVHFVVRTFEILRKHSKRHFSKEQLDLLADRIEDALSAELAGLHV